MLPEAALEPGTPCDDCLRPWGDTKQLLIVWADLGEGAFLSILCFDCWHRREYLADLKSRRRKRQTHCSL